MTITENTIFINGDGSGIRRGLAEGLHSLGNRIVISGRRKGHFDATTAANLGIQSVELIDNAGIMHLTIKQQRGSDPQLHSAQCAYPGGS